MLSNTALVALLGLAAVGGARPAAAQTVNCIDLYNRMIALYQTAPQSPEYAQLAAAYSGNCVANPTVGVAPEGPGSIGGPHAVPSGSLPMRGAPAGTVPTESRALPSGKHK